MTPPPVLEASALSMWRGERCLFRDLGVSVRPGTALHVRGPNGCGKTTLLRILCGLTAPEDGVLRADGEPVRAGDVRLRSLVAYLGHADGLKLELAAGENLRFAAALAGLGSPRDADRVLERLGLAAQARLQTRFLSAGQRRRLAIARLLTAPRRVWVLDEPFTALDAQGCALLEGLMREALHAGTAIVFTSHQAAALDPGHVQVLDMAGQAA